MEAGLTVEVFRGAHEDTVIQVTGDVGLPDAKALDLQLAQAIDVDSDLTVDFARARLTDLAALELFVRLCVRVAGRIPAATVLPPKAALATLEAVGLSHIIDLRDRSSI